MAGSKKPHPYIEQKRGVCGGRPVIKGTRFPVSSVAIQYQQGYTAEDILREFPQLTPAQVYGALAYYFDHQQVIDDEIEQLRIEARRLDQDSSFRLQRHDKTNALPGS
jgi:uncharacterized protein (DUF433 family)